MGNKLTRTDTRKLARPIPDISGADTDDQLIALWLGSHRSKHTRIAYERDVIRFRQFVGKTLKRITLMDVQAFAKSLTGAESSQKRVLSAIKSLMSYGHKTGYLPYNVGAPLKLPAHKVTIAERILSEEDIQKLVLLNPSARNQALLRLLYNAGLRVSEVCSLRWRDLSARDDAGQVTVFGKGGKTRTILLSSGTWKEIQKLRTEKTKSSHPVFPSRKGGGHLHISAVFRIVRSAARRVGLEMPLSPHWLRHTHASHALDRGAPIHLVQTTLGHSSVSTTGVYLHARPSDSSARYLSL